MIRLRLGRGSPWIVLVLLLAVSGCQDLTLPAPPAPPGPGLITGQLVWQRPGRLVSEPAAGARLFVLGSNLAAAADADGRFLLEGLSSGEGTLLVRFDSDGNGTDDRQRSFRLAELGAGPGRQISMGEVLLGRLATVSGRVLRGDVSGAQGHAGTSVFVPGAPFVSVTGDDGRFLFEALPEGPVRFGALRPGYEPFESGELSLHPGESATLVTATLIETTELTQGDVRGRVVNQAGEVLAGVTVTLAGEGAPGAATTDASGTYRLQGVPAGRFDARFERSGFQAAVLYNVVVFGAAPVALPDVTMGEGAGSPSLFGELGGLLDAGLPPEVDAGVIDAGVIDAGVIDAGVIDAGVIDAGVIDAGVIDAGVIDAGVIDAGLIDAGLIDAGTSLCPGADGGAPWAFLDAPQLVDYGELVTFSAGRSVDPDCLPLRYRWTVLDGGVPPFADNDSYTATRQTFVATTAPSEYVLQVQVTDDQSLTAQASARVLVTPRPRVDAGVNFTTVQIPSTVTLDASGSVEELGRALTFTWRLVSGPGQLGGTTGAIVPLTVNGLGLVTAEVSVCHLPQHCATGRVAVLGVMQNQVTASILPTSPDPLLVGLGSSLALGSQVSSLNPQDVFSYAWQAPSGGLSFAPGNQPTTSMTGTSAGDWPVQLQVNAGSASTTVTRTVRVSPPPLAVVDAGVSALAVWMSLSSKVDAPSVNSGTVRLVNGLSDAGIPFTARYDDATGRVVAVFETPRIDEPVFLSLTGATLDGGALGPVAVARTTPQLRVVEAATSPVGVGASDFFAGAAYTPMGPIAVGRFKGGIGSCQSLPCLSAFGLRTVEPQETTITVAGGPTPMRRAVTVGSAVHVWRDNTTLASRADAPTPVWSTPLPNPPGPLFADGFGVWSIGWSSSLTVSMLTGGTWTNSEAVSSVATAQATPRAAGGVFGTTRWVLAIDDSNKAFAYLAPLAMPFTVQGQVASNVTQGRIAVTSAGPVVALRDSSNGLTLFRYTGSTWVGSTVAANGVTGFDLVGRGGTAFLAWSIGNALSLSAVDPSTLNRTVVNPMSGASHASAAALAVGDVELAAGDFGELAMAWSESISGGWRLWLGELR